MYLHRIVTLRDLSSSFYFPSPPANVRQMHAGLYHTYVEHYKEMECFKSIWEDTFYE